MRTLKKNRDANMVLGGAFDAPTQTNTSAIAYLSNVITKFAFVLRQRLLCALRCINLLAHRVIK